MLSHLIKDLAYVLLSKRVREREKRREKPTARLEAGAAADKVILWDGKGERLVCKGGPRFSLNNDSIHPILP